MKGSEVGGMWEEMGRRQFDFMVAAGLKPEHYLLDIGCGSLRGGIHFIRYLNSRRYYGLEKEAALVKAGADELGRAGLDGKGATLILAGDFDLSMLRPGLRFDFMLAQSVFTHLLPEQIALCLERVMPRLRKKGALYATFWEDEELRIGPEHPRRQGEQRFVRYPLSAIVGLGKRAGAKVDYIGDWGHPRGQVMARFYRRG